MNKRIEQLAEQAGVYKLDIGDETAYWVLEKFAQLIVKECAKVILETPVEYLEIDAMHRVRDRVKNHFGVEL